MGSVLIFGGGGKWDHWIKMTPAAISWPPNRLYVNSLGNYFASIVASLPKGVIFTHLFIELLANICTRNSLDEGGAQPIWPALF